MSAGAAVPVTGRFAPSPTGALHFGSLVSAVGSFLSARARGGRWIVRIEDIDTPRSVPGSAEAILRTLEHLGLHWDGPVEYQSRRVDLYQDAFERLRSAGDLYPCTCTRAQIAALSERDGPVPYPGRCRSGPRNPGRAAAWRMRTTDTTIRFADRFRGPVEEAPGARSGDFVVLRSDGIFAYQLAVVVDDAAQDVTEVVRGSDLLDSTARQILLQRRLGLPTPEYGHLPLAVGADGRKLSKREQAPALDPAAGAPALVAALRFLGQHPEGRLRRARPGTVLRWALDHWNPGRVPARHDIVVRGTGRVDLA